MELLCPSAKRRRSEALAAGEPPPRAMEDTGVTNRGPTTHSKELPPPPPLPDAGGGGCCGDVDRISGLPDAILGEIVSLLSTKEAGRTQILASRWRHVWLASPLVLDDTDILQPKAIDRETLTAAYKALFITVSHILSAHPGPVRRFCIPSLYLHQRPATVDAWLSSPALDNVQDLEFTDRFWWYIRPYRRLEPPPASAFRFSATLRVAAFNKCELPDSSVEGIHFPYLKQLGLEHVSISEGSLHSIIASCPALECLLLKDIFGVGFLRISSNSLRSIGVGAGRRWDNQILQDVIIVDAPCLERVLYLGYPMNLTVISAPKLETLGCLDEESSTFGHRPRLVFGATSIQGLKVVRLAATVNNVKTLAVASYHINLDMVIELMKCFPCLENLYIKSCFSGQSNRQHQVPSISRDLNRWRHKHRDFIKSSDIHLKKIVMTYRGTRSQINFASFFLLNARELELMRLDVEASDYNDAFFAEQYGMLQMEKRASRGARLHFSNKICTHRMHVTHVRDLSVADPFECNMPISFWYMR